MDIITTHKTPENEDLIKRVVDSLNELRDALVDTQQVMASHEVDGYVPVGEMLLAFYGFGNSLNDALDAIFEVLQKYNGWSGWLSLLEP